MMEARVLSPEAWQALRGHVPSVKQDMPATTPAADIKEPSKQDGADLFAFAYFVSDGDAIKIGSAQDVWRRIGNLQTAHHRELQLLGAVSEFLHTEAGLHERFAHLRVRGEWFQASEEITAFLDDLRAKGHLLNPPKPDPAFRVARRAEARAIKGDLVAFGQKHFHQISPAAQKLLAASMECVEALEGEC